MRFILLLAALPLLGALTIDYDRNKFAVIKYIAPLQKLYNFRTIVLFYRKNISHLEKQVNLRKFLAKQLNAPIIALNDPNGIELKKIVGNNTISLVYIESVKDPILPVISTTLRGIHYAKVAFVALSHNIIESEIDQLFQWCWAKAFVNVNLVLISVNETFSIFRYDPFPNISIVNITTEVPEKRFENKFNNLHGYKFRSPIKEDLPRVFTSIDHNGQKTYHGIAARIFFGFVEHVNGSFEELSTSDSSKSVNMAIIKRYILQRKIDISVHPYGSFDRTQYGASYPYQQITYCLVVPMRNIVPAYMYLIKPFKVSTWVGIICSIFYISACIVVSSLITRGKKDFGIALCNCICGIMNITMPMKSFPSTKISLLIYIQVVLLGFILSNLYLSKLFSFLTKPFYGKQLNTLEEIWQSDLKILIEDYEADFIKSTKNFPHRYESMLYIVNADIADHHYKTLNTSYGYALGTEQWSLYLEQQRFMSPKKLRVTSACFGQYLISFLMQYDSPFEGALNSFILDIHASGFFDKWESESFDRAVWSGLLHRYKSDVKYIIPKPLTFKNFTLLWYIYLFGILFSIIGFLLEHVRFWHTKHFCKNCHKIHFKNCSH